MEQAERCFKAEKIYIDSKTFEQMINAMEAVRQLVVSLNLNDAAMYEYNTVSEYLVNALYLKNPKIISVSFVAYKYVALKYPDTASKINELAQLLDKVL